MGIRKYQKPSLCKHSKGCLNVLVRVKKTCPNTLSNGTVLKRTCRECEFFGMYENKDKVDKAEIKKMLLDFKRGNDNEK